MVFVPIGACIEGRRNCGEQTKKGFFRQKCKIKDIECSKLTTPCASHIPKMRIQYLAAQTCSCGAHSKHVSFSDLFRAAEPAPGRPECMQRNNLEAGRNT